MLCVLAAIVVVCALVAFQVWRTDRLLKKLRRRELRQKEGNTRMSLHDADEAKALLIWRPLARMLTASQSWSGAL
jgi:hypothetical protein